MAMQVTSSGPQTIQKALNEKVVLGCTYSPGPSDTGELDIEWTLVSPDMTQKDNPVSGWNWGRGWRVIDGLKCVLMTFGECFFLGEWN